MANPFATTAGSIGAGLTGLGAISSLFGGGTVTNPYAGKANMNYADATGNAGTESQGGRQLLGAGEQALDAYGQFAPESNQITQSYLDNLLQDPYTSSYDQAQLSRSTGGAIQGFEQARMRSAQQLGARGLAVPGGVSSELAGSNAGIDAAEAGTLAN